MQRDPIVQQFFGSKSPEDARIYGWVHFRKSRPIQPHYWRPYQAEKFIKDNKDKLGNVSALEAKIKEAKDLIQTQSEDKVKIDSLKAELEAELQKTAQNMAASGQAQGGTQGQQNTQNSGGNDDVIDAEVE
jgi:flagellar biosynthesis/type III secretory pathway protein FliH